MNFKDIDINKIKPDPNQPRSKIDQERVTEMAESLKKHGLINPVEIDDDFTIVTGHIRYEAAKKAGLKTIPCSIVNPENEAVRFQRQVVENIHQNSMNDVDTAKALYKILSLFAPGASKKGKGGHNNKGISYTAKSIGKSEAYVREKLDLLALSTKMQKAILNGLPSSYTRALKEAPDEFKEALEEKMVGEEFQSRESAFVVAEALKSRPDQSTEILNIDFTGMDEKTVKDKITEAVPDYEPENSNNRTSELTTVADSISKAAIKLDTLLKKYSTDDVESEKIGQLAELLRESAQTIVDWIGEWESTREDEPVETEPDEEGQYYEE